MRFLDRATDNMINDLKIQVSRLKMHCTVLDACRKEYLWQEKAFKGLTIGITVVGFTIAVAYILRTYPRGPQSTVSSDMGITTNLPSSTTTKEEWKKEWADQVAKSDPRAFKWFTVFKILASTALSTIMSFRMSLLNLELKQSQVLEWLPQTFRKVYAKSLCKSDKSHDEVMARWHAILPGLNTALNTERLTNFSVFGHKDLAFLDSVLDAHIPRLDRTIRDRKGDEFTYLAMKHELNQLPVAKTARIESKSSSSISLPMNEEKDLLQQ